MHKRSWHPIYTSEGLYYLILYTRSSVHLFAISCDAQLLLQFPSELDLFEICHYGIQSFRHPVISTPSQFDTFWSFRPIFWSIRPTIFFFATNGCFDPVHFLVSNIEQNNKICVFVCSVCCKYFNIIIFFAVYSEKYLFADVYVYFFCSTIADTLSS